MKIIAVILAGGVGNRMNTSIPKQFLTIDRRPIIINTLQNFENNKNIDAIEVVCLSQYIDYLKKLAKKFGITKLKYIVEGGNTNHDSTRNGIFALEPILKKDDFVIIHDAVRPVLPQKILNDMIKIAKEKGNACLAVPCYETVLKTNDKMSGTEEVDRNSIMRVQTPQMYKYRMILDLYKQAEKDNKHNFVYANTLAVYYGQRIFFSKGFNYNFKITTKDDLPFYRSLLKFNEKKLIK